jgi:nicotinamide-nucleotide adenylyltransferase
MNECDAGGKTASITAGRENMTDTGIIHGRFQVLHNDHMKYLMAGWERCRFLVVAITNPDPLLTKKDLADPRRSEPAANPLTYFERHIMVKEALLEAGLEAVNFSIMPFPLHFPELYRFYLPLDGTFYLTIYDRWGRRKLDLFKGAGLVTEILWEKAASEKGLTAHDIRLRMVNGEKWEDCVPVSTAQLMKRWNIPGRIRRLMESGSHRNPE